MQNNKRIICVGFRRWKAANIKPILSLDGSVIFTKNSSTASMLYPNQFDCLIHWGRDAPAGLDELALASGAKLFKMEDGFIRSVGLGSDLIKPLSLVLDNQGIYFDPTKPSKLENILNTISCSDIELAQAIKIRGLIIKYNITKYNTEPIESVSWNTNQKKVLLVPGQVETDASIKYGCSEVKTNLDLLKAARNAQPDSFIVYKPHPDVMSGNRMGRVALSKALQYADLIETKLSIISCINACDEVHTMTSLAGFDALIREKKVIVYGQPFYAGWGLTEDVFKSGVAFQRRKKVLSLNELIVGSLIRYPIYWDWQLKGYTTCEAVINQIVLSREKLQSVGQLDKLRVGYVRRQVRKVKILLDAFLKK